MVAVSPGAGGNEWRLIYSVRIAEVPAPTYSDFFFAPRSFVFLLSSPPVSLVPSLSRERFSTMTRLNYKGRRQRLTLSRRMSAKYERSGAQIYLLTSRYIGRKISGVAPRENYFDLSRASFFLRRRNRRDVNVLYARGKIAKRDAFG